MNAVSASIDRPAPERAIERAAGPELAEMVRAGELLNPPKDK